MAKTKKRIVVCWAKVEELDAEARRTLYATARLVREATNRVWQQWQHHMLSQQRDSDLRIFLECYRRWKENGRHDEKPTLGFYAVDSAIAKKISNMLAEQYPTLHGRVRTLLLKSALARISALPSRKCPGLKLWQAVLLCQESPSVSEADLPIPFDSQNAVFAEVDGQLRLSLRIERFEVPGKINGSSTPITMRLVGDTRRHGNEKFWELVAEAARGQRKWCGSQLVYRPNKRQWAVALAVELDTPPDPPAFDAAQLALLDAPEKDACWRLVAGDDTLTIGSGARIRHLRCRLSTAKEVHLVDPFQSRAGHGRKRLLRNFSAQSGKWQQYTKTLNYQAVARIMKLLAERKISSLEFRPPTAASLINTIGKEFGPAWPAYQFAEILQRKCADRGVALRILEDESDVNAEAEKSLVVTGVGNGETGG